MNVTRKMICLRTWINQAVNLINRYVCELELIKLLIQLIGENCTTDYSNDLN